jgi:CubicO group peptidase (beta-lactamase class C family)
MGLLGISFWYGMLAGQQTTFEEIADQIGSIAQAPITAGDAAGMSISVVWRGDTLLAVGYGAADMELRVPTPDDAVYEIGSVTKQFTGVAALLLQEDGKLSLDDPLTKWLPNYPVEDRTITLNRLLDHTSGIKGYTEMGRSVTNIFRLDMPRDTLVTLFAAEPFEFEPGEAMIYNNSAYFLMGLVIEKASGQDYEDFIEMRLFKPAGMTNSRYCHKDELIPNRAKGYALGREGLQPAPYLSHQWPFAAGSLCSTVRDLMAWNQALHGDGYGGSILSTQSYQELITPLPLVDGYPMRYAKGLAITERDGKRRISHGGGIFGFLSELRYLPEEDLSIAVLINTNGPANPYQIADEIEDLLLGPEPSETPQQFKGNFNLYTGDYRGPARGVELDVTVRIGDDGGLMIREGLEPEQPVPWLRGDTFGSDRGRGPKYVFVRDATNTVHELRIDHVSGIYVLARSSG